MSSTAKPVGRGPSTTSEVSSPGNRLILCVIGSGGVGKSSLTIRYLHGQFPEVSINLQQ